MQGNSGKCHLILSTDEPADIQVGESLIKIINWEKLHGIRVDSKLDKQFILQWLARKQVASYGRLLKLYLTWLLRKKDSTEFFFDSRVTIPILIMYMKDVFD